MVMLAQPQFVTTLLGQVLIGTAYVFFEQGLQDMLLIYSQDNHALYRRLVFVHYLVFTAGCALSSPIAFGLYGASGFATAFYGAAVFACAVGTLLAVYYTCRLWPTPGGVLGNLAAAEAHLKERWRP